MKSGGTVLHKFLKKFKSAEYLRDFAEMFELALEDLPAVPSSYSNYPNAAVGKPLALVNMAWSLELAIPEYANQASLNNSSAKPDSLCDHSWKVKLGDQQRAFDGLISYFCEADQSKQDYGGLSYDFDKFYTYYYDESQDGSSVTSGAGEESPLCPIVSSNYPEFEPFWLDPLQYTHDTDADYKKYFAYRCKKFKAFAALIYPFTPVHAFSSFVPVQTLRLPSWTWQSGMNKMTTFFYMGPLILPEDVPPFQKQYRLQSGYEFARGADVVPGSAVPIPALKVGDWAWLQPYNVPEQGLELTGNNSDIDDNNQSDTSKSASSEPTSSDSHDKDDHDSPAFMVLGLSTLVGGRPRLDVGPYTAVEGFLQLKTHLVR